MVRDWQVGSWSAEEVLQELFAQLVEVHNINVSFQSPADNGLYAFVVVTNTLVKIAKYTPSADNLVQFSPSPLRNICK